MDSYHYINHQITDYLCQKWCNPAPLNRSAPNLVIVENDDRGHPHYKCAFNWTLHALLFLHIQKVIGKQNAKRKSQSDDTDESDEEVGINIDREQE